MDWLAQRLALRFSPLAIGRQMQLRPHSQHHRTDQTMRRSHDCKRLLRNLPQSFPHSRKKSQPANQVYRR
jgi:hypothetical protein